jgi:DNA-binding NarL/FixJ family response regulator
MVRPDTTPCTGDLPADRRPPPSPRVEPPGGPRPTSTTVLVADPDPVTVETLSEGLLDRAMDHVLKEYSTDGVNRILADRRVGELAMIGLGFGDPAYRLIQELRAMGWPRVIALATAIDPGPVADAFRAGATGVLRGHPYATPAGPGPAPNLRLSMRELDVLRRVADGRSNDWISRQLSLTRFTVKRDLVVIGRKFGTGDRARMVAVAMRAGLIR